MRYCRKAQLTRKGRPKACIACNLAKTRCDFATPRCSRCERRGVDCTYDETQHALPDRLAVESQSASTLHFSPSDKTTLGGADWLDWGSFEESPYQGQVDSLETVLPDANAINIGLDDFGSFIGGVDSWERTADVAGSLASQLGPAAAAAAAQDHLTIPHHNSVEHILAKSRATRALTQLSHDTVASQHAANLISRIVSAFPQMMLRRSTFPPFIHAHWDEPALPGILASCVGIARIFVTRSDDTRSFLWRTIGAEEKRFRDEVRTQRACRETLKVVSSSVGFSG